MDTALLEVIRLPGPPYERGRRHGERLAPRIHVLLELWKRDLATAYRIDPAVYLRRFRQELPFEDTIRATAPAILEELRGIADGSGAGYDEIFAFQHINEEFELGPRFAAESIGGGEACSTIASAPTADRPSLMAQNLDLADYLEGFQVMFRYPCDQSDGEILALSVPGMISLNGMNSHGFAVCDNALTELASDPNGLPIFALYRMLLESLSLAQASTLVGERSPAVGLNWVMGDPEGVVMIERSAVGMAVCGPRDGGPSAIHTNHPIVCADWRAPVAAAPRPAPSRSSHLRFAALQSRLLANGPALDVELAKTILSSTDDPDYPVSRGGGRDGADRHIGFTLASSVFELRRQEPLWHLAAGPPHRTQYRTFSFRNS